MFQRRRRGGLKNPWPYQEARRLQGSISRFSTEGIRQVTGSLQGVVLRRGAARALRYLGPEAARRCAAWLQLALDALEGYTPELGLAGLETLQMLQVTGPTDPSGSGTSPSRALYAKLRLDFVCGGTARWRWQELHRAVFCVEYSVSDLAVHVTSTHFCCCRQ